MLPQAIALGTLFGTARTPGNCLGTRARQVLPDIREWPRRIALVLDDTMAATVLAQHKGDWENFVELSKHGGTTARAIKETR